MKKTILSLAVTLFFQTTLAKDHVFSSFQEVLKKHLVEKQDSSGFSSTFDYVSAKSNSATQNLIKKQSNLLKSFDIKSLKTKKQANAFWINTYNFFMITKILDAGFKKGKLKIDGVKDLGSLFDPYKVFKKEDFVVGNKKYSLDGFEKGILLGEEYKKKGWKDARIHFAVNCASIGCPPLRKVIYTEENLDALLTENLEKAMMTSRQIKVEGDTLWLTHLFKWYKKDFEEASGSTKKFLVPYIKDEKFKQKVLQSKKTKFIKYDWNLNKI